MSNFERLPEFIKNATMQNFAASFAWGEDNGAEVAGHGTTRTTGVSQVNWKNTDDVATAYSSSPITAGNNSYSKYQFGIFSGAFNQISNGKWNHVSGVLGAGLSLKGIPTGVYTQPSTTTLGGIHYDLTTTGNIATGLTVTFGGVPENATSGTLSVTGYSCYLVSQLVTTVAASAGDTATVTWALQYDEN